MDFKNQYNEKINSIDCYISEYLKRQYSNVSPVLYEAMRYSVLNGGKRLRSVLCTEVAVMFGAPIQKAMPFAAGVELIHAYSLVHDDLPAMDNSDMRRGQLSCHKKFGEAIGILCGDALLNSAYELMADNCKTPSDLKAMSCISASAGARGMINGQVCDLEISSSKTYDTEILTKLIEEKTMALIRAAILAGAYIANCDEFMINDMDMFSYHLGLAFQIRDDFEDIDQDADESCDSPNFVNFLGKDKAKELLDLHAKKAMEILSKYDGSDFIAALHKFLFD